MRFSQEKLRENVPEGLPAWAFLEQFGGAEFDRASLCTQAAQRLAPVLERFAPAPEGLSGRAHCNTDPSPWKAPGTQNCRLRSLAACFRPK